MLHPLRANRNEERNVAMVRKVVVRDQGQEVTLNAGMVEERVKRRVDLHLHLLHLHPPARADQLRREVTSLDMRKNTRSNMEKLMSTAMNTSRLTIFPRLSSMETIFSTSKIISEERLFPMVSRKAQMLSTLSSVKAINHSRGILQ